VGTSPQRRSKPTFHFPSDLFIIALPTLQVPSQAQFSLNIHT
jgi:hypothetical protein